MTESRILYECVKYSWTQFKEQNLEILGIGNHFIVLISDDSYCIRIAVLDDNFNNLDVLNLESLRLKILSDYINIGCNHKWLIPIYIDIKNIYFPSAFKPKLQSTIYKSIGSKTVWNLGENLMNTNLDQIGQFLAILHTFDYQKDNINDKILKIPIISPKKQLLDWINRITNDRLQTIKSSNCLSTEIYDKCINFIRFCKEEIVQNNSEYDDIFGFSEFDSDEKEEKNNNNDSIWNKYCLIHGDLHTAHLILNDDNLKEINGVIDWSDIRISDIAYEFRYLWTMFGDKCLKQSNYQKYVLQRYGKMENNDDIQLQAKSKQFEQRCRVYGILCSFLSLFWCLESETNDIWRLNITKKLIAMDLNIIQQYIDLFKCK